MTRREVTSKDGTTIAFDRTGGGPPLVLVGGALADRSAAAPLAALLKSHLTVFTYDRRSRGGSGDSAPYAVERDVEDIGALIEEAGGSPCTNRRSSSTTAVLACRRSTWNGPSVPAEAVGEMRSAPFWPAMEPVAHTLAYDGAVMGDTMGGSTAPLQRWAALRVPTLVMDGGASPAWQRNAVRALVDVLPDARPRTLEGENHGPAPEALAPALMEFFTD